MYSLLLYALRTIDVLVIPSVLEKVIPRKDFPDIFPICPERAGKSIRFSKHGKERKFLSETSLSDLLSDFRKKFKKT